MFILLLVLLCVPVGYGFVSIDKPSALKYVWLFAAILLLIAAFGLITRLYRPHIASDIATTTYQGRPATEIRYSMVTFAILIALVGCASAMAVLATLDYASADGVGGKPVVVVLCGLASLFMLSFFWLMAVGQLRRGRVVLTQQGIYQRGFTFTSFLPWESFVTVGAAYNGRPEVLAVAYRNAPWEKRQFGRPWRIDRLPPVPMIEIDLIFFALDASLVYHLVRFYVENPVARAELGTEASLERARVGAFS
ncbi:hypothetical protein [Amycolatopsis cihanbeyliensis]|nr:hypothetical protein [Amycolatopsis cihanbeyliensis]